MQWAEFSMSNTDFRIRLTQITPKASHNNSSKIYRAKKDTKDLTKGEVLFLLRASDHDGYDVRSFTFLLRRLINLYVLDWLITINENGKVKRENQYSIYIDVCAMYTIVQQNPKALSPDVF